MPRPRTAMDKAAEGLIACGEALTGIYNAVAQGLPEAADRADKLINLAERATIALEKAAENKDGNFTE